MDNDDVYKKQLSYILLSGKNRMTVFDQVQEAFQFFSSSINDLQEKMKEIAKMDEIQSLTPDVSSFADWAIKYLSDNSIFQKLTQKLHELIIDDYCVMKSQYKEGIDSIKNNVELIQQKFEEDTENYNSIYKQYLDSCHKLEETAESPDLSALESAKEKCYHLQCEAAKACEQLGIQRRECAKQMEKSMIDFEKLEKQNHQQIQDFLQKFCKITNDFGKSYIELGQKSAEALEKIEPPKRENENNDAEPRDFSEFPPLTFNIFDFLSPKTVFMDDLHATFMQIISPIKIQLHEFTSFDEGERVTVIQKKNDMIVVESERNGIRRSVPKSNLKPCKDYKRKIYQLESPIPEAGLVQGSYVVGILEHPESNSIRCKTASGDFVEISNDKLTLYDKK